MQLLLAQAVGVHTGSFLFIASAEALIVATVVARIGLGVIAITATALRAHGTANFILIVLVPEAHLSVLAAGELAIDSLQALALAVGGGLSGQSICSDDSFLSCL